jgi:hypothetical protein
MTELKFCKDCKHETCVTIYGNLPDYVCEKSSCYHSVTAIKIVASIEFCADCRADKLRCGEDAKWFEPKEK